MSAFWISIKDFFINIFNVFTTFRFVDFLDIALIAILLYGLIKLMRETRAVQLVKGIILLAVVYIFVSIFKMQAISYIFSKVFEGAIIILVILFQQEIRHALEGFGRSGWSTLNFLSEKTSSQSFYSQATKEAINQVCEACSIMSSRKIGALIVFENMTKLGEVIETGTKIDAETTSELVQNIFYPKAPLHDGAVFIKEGKIYAARCILPLTRNTSLDGELGTRHRAAIGMSEQSDAVIVVVSEETGAVSVAFNGRLERGFSSFSLKERLNKLLLEETGQKKPAKKIMNIIRRQKNGKKD